MVHPLQKLEDQMSTSQIQTLHEGVEKLPLKLPSKGTHWKGQKKRKKKHDFLEK